MPNAFSNIGSGVQQGTVASLYGSTPGTQAPKAPVTPTYAPTTPVKSVTSPSGTTTTFHAPTTGTTSGAIKTGTTSNVDNVNKTYEYGGQTYAIDPSTGRYELASSIKQGSNPGMMANSPLNTSSPSGSGYIGQSNAVAPGNADGSTNLNGLTGQPTTQAPVPYTPSTTQGQYISSLANMSQQPSPDYLKAKADADRINQQITDAKSQFAQQTNDINQSGTWTSRALGEQGQANIQNAAVLSALGSQYQGATNQLSAANTQQGLQQNALTSAVGANAPQFPSYSSQVYSPSTGFTQGGSLNDAVSTIAQRVKSGQMSYNDAVSALSGYGQGGTNALQQALGSNFNVAQSNTLASQQGSIGPALQYANTALNNLQSAVSGLNSSQNTNIPIINQITQGLSTQFGVGSQAVQNYKAAIAEARNAIQSVLASVRGGTPTDYVGQSSSLLPDNATPNQIAAAVETLKTLGTAKAGIYQNPGASGASSGSGLYSW